MKKILTAILTALGMIAAGIGSQGCWFLYVDEPEMPSNLIK